MEMAGRSYEAYGLVAPQPGNDSASPSVDQRLEDLAQGLQAMQRAFNRAISGQPAPVDEGMGDTASSMFVNAPRLPEAARKLAL